MSIKALYKNMLQKVASTEFPDYTVDNAEVANKEHEANRGDSRATLTPLFDNTGNVAKADSKLLRETFRRGPQSTHSALVKLAHDAFYAKVRETHFLKTASPAYLQAVLSGFRRELGDIR